MGLRLLGPGWAAAAVIVVLAGCGSSSSSKSSSSKTGASSTTATARTTAATTATTAAPDFKSGFAAATAKAGAASHDIGVELEKAGSQNDAQLQTKFTQLAAEWQQAVSALGTLTPPAAVSSQFATLSDAASRTETDLKAIATAGATHSKQLGTQAVSSLIKDILKAKAAATVVAHKLGIK
jgi:hypothetical protein